MTPLGRGLASLIPRRGSSSAENIIEQIDSMEEIAEAPAKVTKLKQEQVEKIEPAGVAAVVPLDDEGDDDEEFAPRALDVSEELEGDTVPLMPPSRPAVTPLTIDAEPTEEDEALFSEDDELLVAEVSTAAPVQAATDIFPPTTQIDLTEIAKAEAAKKAAEPMATAEDEPQPPEAEKVEEEPVAPETPVEPTLARYGEVAATREAAKAARARIIAASAKVPHVAPKPIQPKKESVTAAAKSVADGRPETTADIPGGDNREFLGEKVQYVALGEIEVNPLQPRRTFDEDELDELMQSIDQHGILQPLVVMETDTGQGYQIIAGERRYRAAKKLKLDKVPVVIRTGVTGDKNRLELALTENVQRQNLNPIEEALGYKRLNEEYGMSHEEIGRRVGRSRVGVTNIMRVLQLPAEIQRGLIENKISIGHARAILMIPDEEKQLRFYHHVLDEGLTVRKTENRARNIQRAMNVTDPMRVKTRGRHELAMKYDGKLQEHYGFNARVKFNAQKNRFEVAFHCYSEDEAVEMIERLLGNRELPENVDEDVLSA